MLPKLPKTILVTGFAPFGGENINPSWQIVKALPDMMAGCRVEKLFVPTEFGQSINVVTSAIDKLKPALILCLGQAGGRAAMSVERIAINVNDACIADNAGAQPIDEAVVAEGPAAYFSTLPIKAMVAGLRAAGFPASVSQTAGTFVCNHLFYGLQHALAGSAVRSGFMHIPYLPEQAAHKPGQPSLPLVTLVDGVRLALRLALETAQDLRLPGGATS